MQAQQKTCFVGYGICIPEYNSDSTGLDDCYCILCPMLSHVLEGVRSLSLTYRESALVTTAPELPRETKYKVTKKSRMWRMVLLIAGVPGALASEAPATSAASSMETFTKGNMAAAHTKKHQPQEDLPSALLATSTEWFSPNDKPSSWHTKRIILISADPATALMSGRNTYLA